MNDKPEEKDDGLELAKRMAEEEKRKKESEEDQREILPDTLSPPSP